MAAHARGDRRFGARISVVVAFIARKFWKRLRGQDTRFGAAAVSFGDPVSLRAFGKAEDVDGLSALLMARIEAVMPVLAVPLLAQALLEGGPMDAAALEQAVAAHIAQIPERSIAVDTGALAKELREACGHMAQHGLIAQRGTHWQIMEDQQGAMEFYANSIAHYLPKAHDAAVAEKFSATAGS